MDCWAAPRVPALPGHGPSVRVYDTATRQVRPVAPGRPATIYVCGITPYDATHLGHAATYLTFDVLIRALRDAGSPTRYVQNVTDVDDPLLERAARTGQDWRDIAAREIDLFRADMTALAVLPPDSYIGAVESIGLVIDMITELIDRGAAYDLDGDVYFSAGSYPRLGEISHAGHSAMVELARERGGDPDRPGKKDPLDALVWRAERPGEPAWASPFGPGRPGWHVECAAIANRYLGPTIDVQGGGMDLIFPHHEMSAAHVCVAKGTWPFARSYVHQAMVGYDGHKMSKSRGNLVKVSELRAAGEDPATIRTALLAHGHRTDWEWAAADLVAARARLAVWRSAVALQTAPDAVPLLDEIRTAVADDLDTPRALRAVDRWAAEARRKPGGEHAGGDPAAPALARDTVEALLGIFL